MAFFEDGDPIGEALQKGEKCWARLVRSMGARGSMHTSRDGEGDLGAPIDLDGAHAIDLTR